MNDVFPIALRRLDEAVAVCRLDPDGEVQPWMRTGPLWSVTCTGDELSVVCRATAVPAGTRHEGPFTAFMVVGPLDFALTGILARLSRPLADAGIPIFVVSTFDTDYVLVRTGQADAAAACWRAVAFTVG